MPVFDLLCFGLCLGLAVSYFLWRRARSLRNPKDTNYNINVRARTAWVAHIMGSEGRTILGIQTLRNSTMAATFFASTAVLLMIGTLNLAGQAEKLANVGLSFQLMGSHHRGLWGFKVLLLVILFFTAFFCFAGAVRLYNHVGFQLALVTSSNPSGISPAHVTALLNQAGGYYAFGMRCYYASLPLIFWLFGPLLMLCGTLISLALLWKLDQAPSHHESAPANEVTPEPPPQDQDTSQTETQQRASTP